MRYPPSKLMVYLFSYLVLLGTTVVPVSSGNIQRQITLLRDLQVTTLTCTPSYALTIAETLTKTGQGPKDLYLKRGIFGAEPWTEEMRTQVEKGLGIQVLDIYGLSEVMGPGVAMECTQEAQSSAGRMRTLHIFEDPSSPKSLIPTPVSRFPMARRVNLFSPLSPKRPCLCCAIVPAICAL